MTLDDLNESHDGHYKVLRRLYPSEIEMVWAFDAEPLPITGLVRVRGELAWFTAVGERHFIASRLSESQKAFVTGVMECVRTLYGTVLDLSKALPAPGARPEPQACQAMVSRVKDFAETRCPGIGQCEIIGWFEW